MSETEAKTETAPEAPTAEEIKGTKRAAEVRNTTELWTRKPADHRSLDRWRPFCRESMAWS